MIKILTRWVSVAAVTAGLLCVVPVLLNVYMPLYVVQSDSMLPTLPVGSVVLVHNHQPAQARQWLDRIVVFHNPHTSRIVVHRVIGVDGEAFVTKGDHNLHPDTMRLSRNQVLGLVFAKLR